jgi:predicted lipoprotein with Yx(FWY)xxD motif/plastocyanin
MPPTRRQFLAATGSCLALAGCSGDDGSTDAPDGEDGDGGDGGDRATPTPTGTGTAMSSAAEPSETTTGPDGGATVGVRSHADLGEILVDSGGRTLYMFDSDERGAGASTCSGGCAESWPPLTVAGDPTAGDGVTAPLTTFGRGDGSTQVAANGWPLYYFASDGAPGDVNGQGVGGVWWVLRPDGTPVRSAGTATETATRTPLSVDPYTVEVAPGGELVFAPETFEVAVGDTVRWVWRGDSHNVRADTTPDGSDWRGTPGNGLFDEGHEYSYTFEVAGECSYYCVPHEGLGMTGSFTVRE